VTSPGGQHRGFPCPRLIFSCRLSCPPTPLLLRPALLPARLYAKANNCSRTALSLKRRHGRRRAAGEGGKKGTVQARTSCWENCLHRSAMRVSACCVGARSTSILWRNARPERRREQDGACPGPSTGVGNGGRRRGGRRADAGHATVEGYARRVAPSPRRRTLSRNLPTVLFRAFSCRIQFVK